MSAAPPKGINSATDRAPSIGELLSLARGRSPSYRRADRRRDHRRVMTVASATVRISSSRHPVPSAWRAMHSERLVGRPVAIAWNRQPNTSALQRNAAVWRNRQKPSSSSGFWRKWPGLGRNLRRRLIWKTLIRSPDRSASWYRAPVPSATIPVPFVTRRRAILRLGRRSPCPSTP